MNAQDARLKLPLYAAGELDSSEAAEMERALEASPELRAELASWESLRACTHRVLSQAGVPAGLEGRVAAALAGRGTGGGGRVFRLGRAALSLAAAILLVLVLYPLLRTDAPTPAPTPPVVLASHTVAPERFSEIYAYCACGEHPHRAKEFEDLSPAEIRMKLASADKRMVLVPDLEAAGYVFDGVCRCFRGEDVRVVHAHYRNAADALDRISLFSTDHVVTLTPCSHACSKYEYATVEDVNIVKWDGKAESFALCGRLAEDRLVALAEQVRVARLAPVAGPAYARLPRSDGP